MPGDGKLSMHELPQTLFDVYALALPRGHGFGNRPPLGAWRSKDDLACGGLTRDDNDGRFGVLVMRRPQDHVRSITMQQHMRSESADGPAAYGRKALMVIHLHAIKVVGGNKMGAVRCRLRER